jgi:arginyl-tRNA synthetase
MKQLNNETLKLFSPLATLFQEDKDSLSYRLRLMIFYVLEEEIDKGIVKFADVKIEHPADENYGDYSTNVAMVMAGRLRPKVEMKPADLAKKLVVRLNNYIRQHQSTSSDTYSISDQDKQNAGKITETDPKMVAEMLEKAEMAGPGFINLTIRKDYLITRTVELLNGKNGVISSSLVGKKIMVEFAHPNTHKEFHIGHLRNISIGESIIRNLEAVGATLFRANYEGDVGLHVAKAIWGVREKIRKEKLKISALRELVPANKAKFLGEGYALGSKMYGEDESVKREIIELNKAIYRDPKKVELWEETRKWSLEYFDTIYHRVDSHFDRLFFESEVEAEGRRIVIEAAAKGIFVKDKDGSIYFPGEKYGLNNCVFVTKEDYATYEGKEIALEELQRKTFPYDLSINNVANEQANFFQLGYKATEILFPWHKGRHFHLAYGMVNFKTGKLSSRTGQVVTVDWLINEAKKKIIEIMFRNSSAWVGDIKLDEVIKKHKAGMIDRGRRGDVRIEEILTIAEKVAIAAVKYSMLKVNPKMDIAFDLEESVNLEGDSGPYLMYTYARCKSVLRKAGGQDTWKESRPQLRSCWRATFQVEESEKPTSFRSLKDINEEELSLLRTFYRFPEVVAEAAKTLSPNLICSFLFDLAQKFNLFYNKHSILGYRVQGLGDRRNNSLVATPYTLNPTSNFRIFLTSATAQILKQGLYILGIETVERM